jgi:predicted amidohydrolase YtcJ
MKSLGNWLPGSRGRRRATSLLMGSIFLAGALAIGSAQAADTPDAIYFNGKIITADQAFSIADAVAIKDGKFVAVGSNDDVKALAGDGTEVVDLAGQTVVPGLMDTHSHLDGAGEGELVVQLGGVKSVEEALERIKAFVADKPAGTWIRSSGWHPPSLIGRYLTRQEIDSVAPNNPVFLSTVGHFAMANSMALDIAGVTKDTPDPGGGKIYRDDNGEATGVLEEGAMDLVEDKLPPLSHEQLVQRNIAAQHVYSSYGITSMVVTGVSEDMIDLYKEVEDSGKQTLRLAPLWRPEIRGEKDTASFAKALDETTMTQNSGDEWVKISGIKISIDGGMTLKTAFTRDPYLDDPNYYGTISVDPKVYKEAVKIAADHGWRIMTHAVGDRAVDLVLDAYDAIKHDGDVLPGRYTITHGSLINPDQVARAKKMGVRVDGQNVFMWEKAATVAKGMGMERAQRAVPTRMLIDELGFSGTAAGTDSPGTNVINPYINMYIMVTRKDPNGDVYGADQAITREEALRLYTNAGPYFTFEEDQKGSIEPGKFADMVVLSDDFLTIPEEQIKDLNAVKTIVGGKVVYDAAVDGPAHE